VLINKLENDRRILCYENCGHEADLTLEIGHARVLICEECLGMLMELLQVELSR
jgi:hypothetical protein